MDISPDKQNIDKLFGTTAFYIDFYQRHYKWTDEPVRRLLDDVFYAFETDAEQSGFEHVYFNGLNEMDSQYMLVLSACTTDDPEEDEKIVALR